MALTNETTVLMLQAVKTITQKQDQCFTAFDVTKVLRSLTPERIDHKDVRGLLHTFYSKGFLKNYTRTPHSFNHRGETCFAQLFVPPNGDPSAYNPDQILQGPFQRNPNKKPSKKVVIKDLK